MRMKKAIVVMFLLSVTSCTLVSHQPHRHLELVRAKELRPEVLEFNSYRSNFNEIHTPFFSFDSVQVNLSQDSLSKNMVFKRNFIQNKNEDQIVAQQNAYSLPGDTTKQKRAEKRPYNKTAVWAGIFTAAGLLTSILTVIFGTVGLILGIIALHKIKKNPSQRGRGFAITAIILGIFSFALLVAAIVFIIACSQPGADCP